MDDIVKRIAVVLLLALSACGGDQAPATKTVEVPSWAKVAPEQLAEAKKHGVPVAFENDLGMRFVLIPAGTFLMGSPKTEVGRSKSEAQRGVALPVPFYMQVKEVTNAQYRRWKEVHDSKSFGDSLSGDDQPVAWVSWDEASAFAGWVSQADTLREYGLPMEAMWEYACRAGSTTRFWWGESEKEGWRCENANDAETNRVKARNWMGWSQDDGFRVSAPVGSYPPNGWGLHDMGGNVREWCLDWYVHPREQEPEAKHDMRIPLPKTFRVHRGGSWDATWLSVRSASGSRGVPDSGHWEVGIRLVSPLPE